ncbi:MAG: hypothetical protein ACPGVD_08275 [Flavobacteriales bacterium]
MNKIFYISIVAFGIFVLVSFSKKESFSKDSIVGTWVVDHFFQKEDLIEFKRKKKLKFREHGYVFKKNGELIVKTQARSYCANAYNKKKDFAEYKGRYEILNDSTFKLIFKVYGDSTVDELKIVQLNKNRLVTDSQIYNVSISF